MNQIARDELLDHRFAETFDVHRAATCEVFETASQLSGTRCVLAAHRDLFGIAKPLLQIDLARPLDGADVTGHVTALRPLPRSSICSGAFEVEGVDYAGGTLRVLVMSPGFCVVVDSKSWRFRTG